MLGLPDACTKSSRRTVRLLLLRLGEQSFDLPHPLGHLLAEDRISHPGLHFLEKVLVQRCDARIADEAQVLSGFGWTG